MNKEFLKIEIRGIEVEVNREGLVRKNGKPANIRLNHDGYEVVTIKDRAIGVHRLVALAFIANDEPNTKLEVNHLDFNRTNNHVSNLKWVTHLENIEYSRLHGRYKMRNINGANNPNYNNDTLKKKYKDDPKLALEKQSRKGSVNGMSKSIELYKDGNLIDTFEYIGLCCEYLHLNHGFSSNAETVRIGIRRSISKNVPYKGFTFKKMTT